MFEDQTKMYDRRQVKHAYREHLQTPRDVSNPNLTTSPDYRMKNQVKCSSLNSSSSSKFQSTQVVLI